VQVDTQLRSGSVAFPRIEVLASPARYAAVGAEARSAERTAVERKSVLDMVQLMLSDQLAVVDRDRGGVRVVYKKFEIRFKVELCSAEARPFRHLPPSSELSNCPASSSIQS
jgi:hypothetical protein